MLRNAAHTLLIAIVVVFTAVTVFHYNKNLQIKENTEFQESRKLVACDQGRRMGLRGASIEDNPYDPQFYKSYHESWNLGWTMGHDTHISLPASKDFECLFCENTIYEPTQ